MLESRWLQRTRPTSWLGPVPALYTPLKKARQRDILSDATLPGRWGAFDVSKEEPVGSCGVRKKTRGRAGTPDAGALLFNVLLLFGWGYRVTPGISPGSIEFWP